jgi:RHS repeat-associated protein
MNVLAGKTARRRAFIRTDALAKTWLFDYDLNSNVIKTTDPKGQIITATYTYGGILTTQSAYKFLGDPAPQVTTSSRNDLGQVITTQSPVTTTTYGYDTARRLQSVTDSRGAKTFTYTYSNGGRLKRLQDSEGKRTDYLYDPVGRLTGLWAANNDLITFLRDRGGRLTEKWFPSGVNTRYAYNDDNTLQQIVNRLTGSSGAVISQNEYTYDGVGNRKTATEKAGSTTTPATSEAYGYDPLGNRSYKSDTTGATFYYSYDAANQLKDVRTGSATGTITGALVYDANGNVIQKCEGGTVTTTTTSCTGTTVSTLTYDVYNRLTQVQKTGLATQTYQYDDQGRRISKTIGTATTNYLYNGDNLYAEYSTWATPLAGYTHGPGTDDQLIRTTPTANQYYHKDGLGSVVALTDTSGATLGTQLYDAWGNKLAVTSSGSIAQYGYTGREPDETGLIYYRARYYDPSVGRFTQRDPSGFKGGLNLYAYVNGNPVNKTDPTGMTPIPLYDMYDTSGNLRYFMGGGSAGYSPIQPPSPLVQTLPPGSGGANTGIGPFKSAEIGVSAAFGPAVSFAVQTDLETGQAYNKVALGIGTPNAGAGPSFSTDKPSAGFNWTGNVTTPSIFNTSISGQISWDATIRPPTDQSSRFDSSLSVNFGRSPLPSASLMFEGTFATNFVAPQSITDVWKNPVSYIERDAAQIGRDFRNSFSPLNWGFGP